MLDFSNDKNDGSCDNHFVIATGEIPWFSGVTENLPFSIFIAQ